MTTTPIVAAVTGPIDDVKVADGAIVKAGDIIMVQHTAKSENNIMAPVGGQVKLNVGALAHVTQGDKVAEIIH